MLVHSRGIMRRSILSRGFLNEFLSFFEPANLSTLPKNCFPERTHTCNELDRNLVGKEVALRGWLQKKQSPHFFAFHDGYGQANLIIQDKDLELSRIAQNLNLNSVVLVKGLVCLPVEDNNKNHTPKLVEIAVKEISIIEGDSTGIENTEKIGHQVEDTLFKPKPQYVKPISAVNAYSVRSHTCGELRGTDAGKDVTLCGWLQYQRMNKFATIRDSYGATQLLIPEHLSDVTEKLISTTAESIISVNGVVATRPADQVSPKMVTGEIEVVVTDFEVLNPAKANLPFLIREHNKAKEPLRLKHRYIDLRFPVMQRNLRLRSRLLMEMREFLINHREFVEVETPTLFRRTPGGAQEFVVPTNKKDEFYSLVQSPQQLKQMLMAGAVDRYFQVARCYRDEDTRSDRQPEFTQMDIELSFTNREGIMTLIEDLLEYSWPESLPPIVTPFPRLSYRQAMDWYGCDKPDITFENKIVNFFGDIENQEGLSTDLKAVENLAARALVIPKGASKYTASVKSKYESWVKNTFRGTRYTPFKVTSEWQNVLKKILPMVTPERLKKKLNFNVGDLVLLAIGKEEHVLPLLGKLRLDFAPEKNADLEKKFEFLWVTDFPLFLPESTRKLESAHHPFTQPHPSDEHLLKVDPLKVRGLHYDLVLNGVEIGGGSIRIHNSELQKYVLHDILQVPVEPLQHMLDALESGCPPHGGIALGIDRLMSVLAGADSIRDVIAFPKSYDGKDPLSGAPCNISDEERKRYHLTRFVIAK